MGNRDTSYAQSRTLSRIKHSAQKMRADRMDASFDDGAGGRRAVPAFGGIVAQSRPRWNWTLAPPPVLTQWGRQGQVFVFGPSQLDLNRGGTVQTRCPKIP